MVRIMTKLPLIIVWIMLTYYLSIITQDWLQPVLNDLDIAVNEYNNAESDSS